ncbi:hypothetical protein CPLU01_08510 [Colletotrichum plurivorum]|uniref:Enoyl-CoA hydratase/isomerase n=1 Tax=Colletotrichum plurivorum TaxID=2175906 RepID=A0A8H6KBM1_9PEZI|nr:hypothetical protein CPLU01_08510 [Colletotrichum plurivorum]
MTTTTVDSIPKSYSSLGYKDILVSHVPADAPTATKVILVTLNRPQKHNAVNENILVELESIYNLLDRDERVRTIVLTGAGKSFCSGMDLSGGPQALAAFKQNQKSAEEWRDPGGRVSMAISNCVKPTIVAVNGAAAGVGLTSILSAAIRVAWQGAKISLPFSRRGLTMESCSAFYLPRFIGLSKAMHVVTTGHTYAPFNPMVEGLFSRVLLTPEETLNYALELAADVAENTSLFSTKMMRDMMVHCPDTPEATHVLDSRVFVEALGSAHNIEGMASFIGKRQPEFAGGFDRSAYAFWPWWKSADQEEPIGRVKAKI